MEQQGEGKSVIKFTEIEGDSHIALVNAASSGFKQLTRESFVELRLDLECEASIARRRNPPKPHFANWWKKLLHRPEEDKVVWRGAVDPESSPIRLPSHLYSQIRAFVKEYRQQTPNTDERSAKFFVEFLASSLTDEPVVSMAFLTLEDFSTSQKYYVSVFQDNDM
jgi:hypothetical protein